MYRYLINILSIWELMVFTMVALIVIAYAASFIASFWRTEPLNKHHREIANTVIGLLSGGLFILLAFVIVSSWEYYIKADDIVSREASYIGIIFRNAAIFPAEFSEKIRAATAKYVVAVRTDEWEAMRQGKESAKAWDAINDLYATLDDYSPQPGKESIFYEKLIDNVNYLLEARRERLSEVDSIIPPTLRNSLIIGSVILALLLGGIQGERSLYNLMPLLFFVGILGFNLALAWSFDYPFAGDVSINKAKFYQGSLSGIPGD